MIVSRGIKYHTIEDVKDSLFETMQAKELERMILDSKINIERNDIDKVKLSTTKLSFFVGEYEIICIPVKLIELVVLLKSYEKDKENPIITDTRSINSNITKTENDIQKLKDTIESSEFIKDMNCFVIIFSFNNGSKQLNSVLSGIPRKFEHLLSDARIYDTIEGQHFVASDGIPMEYHIHYYMENNQLFYTSNPAYNNVGE